MSFVCLMSLLCLTSTMAQGQDQWVGTWTSESYREIDYENSPKNSEGTFVEIIYTDYKKVFRITKNGEEYLVRGKTIKVNDPNYSSYHRPYTVTSINGNTMWLKSSVTKLPFRVNGQIDSYSDVTYYYKLTLTNGVLRYTYLRYHSVDYDKNMRFTGEEDYDASIYSPRDYDLNLFSDDW